MRYTNALPSQRHAIILLVTMALLSATINCSLGKSPDGVPTQTETPEVNKEATEVFRQATENARERMALETSAAESTAEAGNISSTEAARQQRATLDSERAADTRATEAAYARLWDIVGEIPRGIETWKITHAESFESEDSIRNDWLVGSQEDEWVKMDLGVRNGSYWWSIYAKQSTFYRIWPPSAKPSDVYIVMDLCKEQGSATNALGITFRHDTSGNAYVFLVRNDRRYAFFEMVSNTWNTRIDWTQASELIPGGCNRIALLAEGSHFTLFANGVEIDELTDVSLDSGAVGIGIFIQGGESAEWLIDNFAVLVP